MVRVSKFLLLAISILICTSNSTAQEMVSPTHAIGKRVKLKVKSRNEGEEFTCTGIVVQVDLKKLILENVIKTRVANRGVPFLSNLNSQEKIFTNVAAVESVALEFDIVLSLDRIKSCTLVTAEPEKDSLRGTIIVPKPPERAMPAPEQPNRPRNFREQGTRNGFYR